MHRWKFICEVEKADIRDLDQWLAHHANGRHETVQQYERGLPAYVSVFLVEDADRLALREAFDLRKVRFLTPS